MRSSSVVRLMKRYFWLYDRLMASRVGLTLEEIAAAWARSSLNDEGVAFSSRTFFEHRRAIEELFDVDIVCNREAGNRYMIVESSTRGSAGARRWGECMRKTMRGESGE